MSEWSKTTIEIEVLADHMSDSWLNILKQTDRLEKQIYFILKAFSEVVEITIFARYAVVLLYILKRIWSQSTRSTIGDNDPIQPTMHPGWLNFGSCQFSYMTPSREGLHDPSPTLELCQEAGAASGQQSWRSAWRVLAFPSSAVWGPGGPQVGVNLGACGGFRKPSGGLAGGCFYRMSWPPVHCLRHLSKPYRLLHSKPAPSGTGSRPTACSC